MCSVLGFYSPDPRTKHLEVLCNLFDQSKIRGLHAFGFSAWEGRERIFSDGIRTFKSHSIKNVKESLMSYRYSPPQLIIGHGRYSTSGDWAIHDNNQPIHTNNVSVVFNGVISQATREENEKKHGKTFVTDNDGEIFLRKFSDGEDWEGFVAKGKFSFAGLVMNKGEVYALRNKNRPLWIAESYGAIYVASTKDIFNRTGGFSRVREVPVGKALKIKELLP